MNIKSRTRNGFVFEIVIEEGNTTITNDVAESNGTGKPWTIDKTVMTQFEGILLDMAEFNGLSREEFLFEMIGRCLHDHEKESLIEHFIEDNSPEPVEIKPAPIRRDPPIQLT